MKIRWVLFEIALVFIVGCRSTQTSVDKTQPVLERNNQAGQSSSQENFTNQEEAPTQPPLSLPTIGSVVITNTTATPIPPGDSVSALTPAPVLLELADRAKRDLAKRLGVDANQIELAKIVPAKWPYDSIGCPLPNGESINASTLGYQILLEANGQIYIYHTDGSDQIGLCSVKPPNEIRTLP